MISGGGRSPRTRGPAIDRHLRGGRDDRYRPVSRFEFRDKNHPLRQRARGRGRRRWTGPPELRVAQAGGAYLLASDRDDRFLPVWYAPRAPRGALAADLDGDGRAEIFLSERGTGAPRTRIYGVSSAPAPPALAWQAIREPPATPSSGRPRPRSSAFRISPSTGCRRARSPSRERPRRASHLRPSPAR